MEYTMQEIFKKAYMGTITPEEEKYYIDHFMSEEEKQIGKPMFRMNRQEEVDYEVLTYNSKQGDMAGYDCPKCKNKGDIAINNDNSFCVIDCDCLSIRKTIRLMEKSKLGNLLDLYSFDNYECTDDWQNEIYNTAKEFINSNNYWFYIGGNSGIGKSHICTALAKELMKQGKFVKYMLWLDESTTLKQTRLNDKDKYNALMNEIKNAEVLYIDDFLKVGKNDTPTTADINLAMEILNYRYVKAKSENNRRYITILSSERNIGEIMDFDEATGSRIVEMTKPNYYIFISKDQNKNYRLK